MAVYKPSLRCGAAKLGVPPRHGSVPSEITDGSSANQRTIVAGAVTVSPLSRHEHFLQTGDSVTGAQESAADNSGQQGEDEVEFGPGVVWCVSGATENRN